MSDFNDYILVGLVFTVLFVIGMVGSTIVVSSDMLPQALGYNRVDYNKTGFVEDIEFLGGVFISPSQILIRFTNGDVVVLQGWRTRISVKQNITLCYHDNGFGTYFLDNFTKIGGEQK